MNKKQAITTVIGVWLVIAVLGLSGYAFLQKAGELTISTLGLVGIVLGALILAAPIAAIVLIRRSFELGDQRPKYRGLRIMTVGAIMAFVGVLIVIFLQTKLGMVVLIIG